MIKMFQSSLLLVFICGIFFFPATGVLADDDDSDQDVKEIDIGLSPKKHLFDISNMKPGDWATRTITVNHSSSTDFPYHMKVRNNGNKKLFNELMLEIKAGDQELYLGKLAAFTSLPARKLVSNNKENLDITIRMPTHLGNDFQGLGSAFAFVFTADGLPVPNTANGTIDSSNDPAASGLHLPKTSTNIFNLMLLGSALITAGIVIRLIKHWRETRVDK